MVFIMKKFLNSAFIRFFTKFHKLLFASLFFTVPLAIFTTIFVSIGSLLGFNNIVVWFLGLIPTYPLYSGFVMVVRKYAVEKLDCNVVEVFWKTVKENWKKSLLNGVVFYIILTCAVFSLMYYGSLIQFSFVYQSIFTMYMIFSLALLIMTLYIPLMTVTYELRLRDIYKNSAILIIAKILRNICALIPIALISFAAFFFLDFTGGWYSALTIIVTAILYPILYTYLSITIISKGVQENVGEFVVKAEKRYEEKIVSIDEQVLKSDDNSDYIFVNGRMVKNPNKEL